MIPSGSWSYIPDSHSVPTMQGVTISPDTRSARLNACRYPAIIPAFVRAFATLNPSEPVSSGGYEPGKLSHVVAAAYKATAPCSDHPPSALRSVSSTVAKNGSVAKQPNPALPVHDPRSP